MIPRMSSELRTTMDRQPADLRRILADPAPAEAAAERLRDRTVFVVGTGTSWHACNHGGYLLRAAGLDARPIEAFDAAIGGPMPVRRRRPAAASHRNTKRYATVVRERAAALGVPTVVITGIGAGGDVETVEGETSAAFTASHLGALARVAQIAVALGATLGDLDAVPDAVAAALAGRRAAGVKAPQRLLEFTGAGTNAWTAAEGALKVRETATSRREGLSAEQLFHGPSVGLKPGDTLVALDGGGPGGERVLEIADGAERFGVRRAPHPRARPRRAALVLPADGRGAADRARARRGARHEPRLARKDRPGRPGHDEAWEARRSRRRPEVLGGVPRLQGLADRPRGAARAPRRRGPATSRQRAVDVHVVNGCAVTNEALAKTRQACAARWPAARPRRRDRLRRATRRDRAWPTSGARARRGTSVGASAGGGRGPPRAPRLPRRRRQRPADRARAFLKVQDGCSFRCAFCVIPQVRGATRSRALAEVVAEARARVAAGHRELVLTGVNIGLYRDRVAGARLADVVAAVAADSGAERVRLSSIEVDHLEPRLLEALAADPAVMPHLHVPLQSGDDGVLRAMRRRDGAERYQGGSPTRAPRSRACTSPPTSSSGSRARTRPHSRGRSTSSRSTGLAGSTPSRTRRGPARRAAPTTPSRPP